MMRPERPTRLLWLALATATPMACEPDEVQNSANEAVVMVQFFASRTHLVPVAGVRMLVESPADQQNQQQGRPYNGPDVLAISGDDGIAIARVFPGLDDPQDGGGDGGDDSQGEGPENPLDLPPPLIFADVAITFIYQGQIVPFIETGFTIGSGRLYDLGPIFLDELGVTVE
ncbi:MAG TPA: hypothetical protein VJP59_09980 [Gemmatimonadota bacterium]|nr:hypothetical protein [Gemmatimonadota bacterium]